MLHCVWNDKKLSHSITFWGWSLVGWSVWPPVVLLVPPDWPFVTQHLLCIPNLICPGNHFHYLFSSGNVDLQLYFTCILKLSRWVMFSWCHQNSFRYKYGYVSTCTLFVKLAFMVKTTVLVLHRVWKLFWDKFDTLAVVGEKKGRIVAAAEAEIWTVESQEILVAKSQKYGLLTLTSMAFCQRTAPRVWRDTV